MIDDTIAMFGTGGDGLSGVEVLDLPRRNAHMGVPEEALPEGLVAWALWLNVPQEVGSAILEPSPYQATGAAGQPAAASGANGSPFEARGCHVEQGTISVTGGVGVR